LTSGLFALSSENLISKAEKEEKQKTLSDNSKEEKPVSSCRENAYKGKISTDFCISTSKQGIGFDLLIVLN